MSTAKLLQRTTSSFYTKPMNFHERGLAHERAGV